MFLWPEWWAVRASFAEIWTSHCNEHAAVKGCARKVDGVDVVCLIKDHCRLFSENPSHISQDGKHNVKSYYRRTQRKTESVLGFCINLQCVVYISNIRDVEDYTPIFPKGSDSIRKDADEKQKGTMDAWKNLLNMERLTSQPQSNTISNLLVWWFGSHKGWIGLLVGLLGWKGNKKSK